MPEVPLTDDRLTLLLSLVSGSSVELTFITRCTHAPDLLFPLHLQYLEDACNVGWMFLSQCSLPVRKGGNNEPAVSFKPSLTDFLFTWRLCNKLQRFHYEVEMSNVLPVCLHNRNPQSFISIYLVV